MKDPGYCLLSLALPSVVLIVLVKLIIVGSFALGVNGAIGSRMNAAKTARLLHRGGLTGFLLISMIITLGLLVPL